MVGGGCWWCKASAPGAARLVLHAFSHWLYDPGVFFHQSESRHVVSCGDIILTLERQFYVVIRWGELMQK